MMIAWANETRKLRDLIPWERNPREINTKEAQRLGDSLEEFGQIQTIAIGPNDEVYDGHQRKAVWSLLPQFGPDHEVDVRVSSRTLTDKERQKLVVYLHRGTAGTWDWDELANSFEVPELLEWGFEESELQLDWGNDATPDPGAQVDKAAELQKKWQVQRGQVWQVGRHRVMCFEWEDADPALWTEAVLLLTDPPYGISIVKGDRAAIGGSKAVTIGTIRPCRPYPFGGAKNIRGTDGAANMVDATPYRPVHGDDKPFDPAPLLEICGNQIIFGGNYFASKLPDSRCWIVWDKNNTGDFADAELAWTSFDRSVKLYQHTWNGLQREGSRKIEGKKRMHPTQKPAGLFANILQDFSEDGDTIVDLYLGSGTTLVACEVSGRQGIGVEIDPAYVAVTLERLTGIGLEARLCDG